MTHKIFSVVDKHDGLDTNKLDLSSLLNEYILLCIFSIDSLNSVWLKFLKQHAHDSQTHTHTHAICLNHMTKMAYCLLN